MRIPVLCTVALFAGGLFAQAPEPLPAPVCNADFAQLLVQQQVMEGRSVTDPVKRIKILNRSADFLWPFDEPTARSYFAESWKMADDRFKETGFETKKSTTSTIVTLLPDQRMEVIRAIAKKDSEWAKKLSEQMLKDYEKAATDRKSTDQTREIEGLLALATASVKTNPELSRSLFRRLMRYPLFTHWFFAFYQTAKDDAAFANSLYSEALATYRNAPVRQLLYLSAYPFANERIFGADKYSVHMGPQPDIVPNPDLQRMFIETFFARIERYAASAEEMNQTPEKNYPAPPVYMVSALRDMEPIVVQQFPDLLQRLSVAKSQAASLMSAEMGKTLEERDKWTSGLGQSFDEILAEIEKADGEGKLTDGMVLRLLTGQGRTEEQFEKILPWLDRVKEESPRREMTNYFWFLRASLAIKEKRWEDAEKFTAKVPEAEHRAVLMFEMAALQAKNESDTSILFETLNRLSKVTRSSENSVSKAQVILGLANMYQKVNHSTALDELAEAIRVTNSLKDPDIFMTSVRREIKGKTFTFFASFGTPGYNLEETFVELSKKNFEMSLGHAKALNDRYFRTLAVIAVASNCVKNSKTTAKPKPNAN